VKFLRIRECNTVYCVRLNISLPHQTYGVRVGVKVVGENTFEFSSIFLTVHHGMGTHCEQEFGRKAKRQNTRLGKGRCLIMKEEKLLLYACFLPILSSSSSLDYLRCNLLSARYKGLRELLAACKNFSGVVGSFYNNVLGEPKVLYRGSLQFQC